MIKAAMYSIQYQGRGRIFNAHDMKLTCHCDACAGRDLVNMAKNRPNVIPIIEDARHPQKYRMLVPMVDAVFADVAQPDQASQLSLQVSFRCLHMPRYLKCCTRSG